MTVAKRPTVDADKGLAVVGPGKGGSLLMADLEAQGLFFPGGHCKGVGLGGYLLLAGFLPELYETFHNE